MSFVLPDALPLPGSKVLVGLSGGVDSAVCAAVLQEQGLDVSGIFLRFFDDAGTDQAQADAARVADHLHFPLLQADCRALFHEKVILPFIHAYCQGKTPLPCGWCNPSVKFEALMHAAKTHAISIVATGHYAQTKPVGNTMALYAAEDPHRDQSYFLYRLSDTQLSHALFPLGQTSKSEIRAYAEKHNIPIAQKRDSQDICFLARYQGKYADLILDFFATQKELPEALTPGPILDLSGQKLGTHKGLIHYTIGQRRGLGISAKDPLYVVQLRDNAVVVGGKADLAVWRMTLKDVFFHTYADIRAERTPILCQFRSTMPPTPAWLENNAGQWSVVWDTPQYGVSPGQICVLRDHHSMILGGGEIALPESVHES